MVSRRWETEAIRKTPNKPVVHFSVGTLGQGVQLSLISTDWNSSSGLVESVSNGFGLAVCSRQQCR